MHIEVFVCACAAGICSCTVMVAHTATWIMNMQTQNVG